MLRYVLWQNNSWLYGSKLLNEAEITLNTYSTKNSFESYDNFVLAYGFNISPNKTDFQHLKN